MELSIDLSFSGYPNNLVPGPSSIKWPSLCFALLKLNSTTIPYFATFFNRICYFLYSTSNLFNEKLCSNLHQELLCLKAEKSALALLRVLKMWPQSLSFKGPDIFLGNALCYSESQDKNKREVPFCRLSGISSTPVPQSFFCCSRLLSLHLPYLLSDSLFASSPSRPFTAWCFLLQRFPLDSHPPSHYVSWHFSTALFLCLGPIRLSSLDGET